MPSAEHTPNESDDLRWVVMRSLINKVSVSQVNSDGKTTVERKYGYETAQSKFREFFMPMKEAMSVVRGKRIVRHEPAIAGLFFVKDTLANVQRLADGSQGFELKFIKGRKYREPVVIPEKEMDAFIQALGTASEVRFFLPDDPNLKGKIGQKVRIHKDQSHFDGHIISIRGSKRRWLRISIEGYLVAEMEFDLDALRSSGQFIELLP